ncbi:MAG: sulfurtransferase TusA family protein [Thermodesulfovibrionales bacterium]|nr:sulfurtransferase TusA family protein [Thermodesulfovibrionales bacterium]
MYKKRDNIKMLDTLSLKCPEPILKIAARAVAMKQGDILEVRGDCPTFEKDIKMWCKRAHKTLLFIENYDNGKMKCQIEF